MLLFVVYLKESMLKQKITQEQIKDLENLIGHTDSQAETRRGRGDNRRALLVQDRDALERAFPPYPERIHICWFRGKCDSVRDNCSAPCAWPFQGYNIGVSLWL